MIPTIIRDFWRRWRPCQLSPPSSPSPAGWRLNCEPPGLTRGEITVAVIDHHPNPHLPITAEEIEALLAEAGYCVRQVEVLS